MSWESDIDRFTVKLTEAIPARIMPAVASELYASIVDGSPLTGSPGQPVDTGNLRTSWQVEFPAADTARITTNVEYAPYVEDGINRWGAVQYHNHGPHSVKLTLAGAQQVVNKVARDAA